MAKAPSFRKARMLPGPRWQRFLTVGSDRNRQCMSWPPVGLRDCVVHRDSAPMQLACHRPKLTARALNDVFLSPLQVPPKPTLASNSLPAAPYLNSPMRNAQAAGVSMQSTGVSTNSTHAAWEGAALRESAGTRVAGMETQRGAPPVRTGVIRRCADGIMANVTMMPRAIASAPLLRPRIALESQP